MTQLPYLTADVPGCGGAFKQTPEDFVVDEVPAYEPSGEGEHLFLRIEKRGRSTIDVAKDLSRQLGISERDISWAGLKDRQALTRQTLCFPAKKTEERIASLVLTGATVLEARRHRNKLKSGHLKGNVFGITLRGVADLGAARATLERLAALGVPNYYGEQRFGLGGDNAAKGKAILLAGGRHRDRFERKLFLSAFQSDLFNRVLARRVQQGQVAKALLGDVLKKHFSGGEFLCEAPGVDQPRVEAFEVSATGPMFGPQMRAPGGAPAEAEAEVLAEAGVTPATFEAGGDETRGTRRLVRVPLTEASVEGDPAALRLRFFLPAGSYATVVLRELVKGDG